MSNLNKAWIFFGVFLLASFFGNAIISDLFPNLSDFWQTLVKLFVITILVCGFFIFSRRTHKVTPNVIPEIGQTPVTLFLGIYVVAVLSLGSVIQIYLFPEIADFSGPAGDIGLVGSYLAYLWVAWIIYKKIKQ
ncbi:MAG: hypothetical protein Q7S08_01605 [bacterium]|nr:hypothetical protein [bacterium]